MATLTNLGLGGLALTGAETEFSSEWKAACAGFRAAEFSSEFKAACAGFIAAAKGLNSFLLQNLTGHPESHNKNFRKRSRFGSFFMPSTPLYFPL